MSFDARINRREGYIRYHAAMMAAGDCDPQYPAMLYISDRMELNPEQRLWLAFLFSLSYCAPTAFYMFNEFPDYENVDTRRLQRWWDENKAKTFFQTDRRHLKNNDLVVRSFASYRDVFGASQGATWARALVRGDPKETYRRAWATASRVFYMGRFSLFLFLEAVAQLSGMPMEPDKLDLRDAESCRDGLCRAIGRDDLVGTRVTVSCAGMLQRELESLVSDARVAFPQIPTNLWNIETSLCAYKKLHARTRYFGYYIDRQQAEIYAMQRNVPDGVYWQLLWDFRRAYFRRELLGEVCGWAGPRCGRLREFAETGFIGGGAEQFLARKARADVYSDRRMYQ